PILAWARDAGADEHLNALTAMIEECRRLNRALNYGGHLALREDCRDRAIHQLMRELTAAAFNESTRGQGGGAAVLVSVLRTKTNIWFENIGFKPLSWEEQSLPAI